MIKSRRFLSLLLVVIMTLSMFPVNAFAESGLNESNLIHSDYVTFDFESPEDNTTSGPALEIEEQEDNTVIDSAPEIAPYDITGSDKVLIWSPKMTDFPYQEFVTNLSTAYTGFGAQTKIAAEEGVQEALPELVTSGSANYDLMFIVLPSVAPSADEISELNSYLAAGGRIVLIGENPSAASTENAILSNLAAELGATFTITGGVSLNGTTIINGDSKLSSGLTDATNTPKAQAAAPIDYSGKAQWVLEIDGAAWCVDQVAGTIPNKQYGRITAISDVNWVDYMTTFVPSSEQFLKNLLEDSKANIQAVNDGKNPNADFEPDTSRIYVKEVAISGNGSFVSPFATLQEAYNAVGSGGEIRILSDLAMKSTTTFNGNKSVTIQSYTGNSGESVQVKTDGWIVKRDTFTEGSMLLITQGNIDLQNIVFDGDNIAATVSMGPYDTGEKCGGAAVTVDGSGTSITMQTGAVLQNHKSISNAGKNSSSVGISRQAEFIMNDGTIKGNTGGYSGAVYIEGGTFTMNGGNITGNEGEAGGVHITLNGTFVLTGGTISGNTSRAVDTGAGVNFYPANSKMFVRGSDISIIIKNNKYSDGTEKNVNLFNGAIINLEGTDTKPIAVGSEIGVTMQTMPTPAVDKVTVATGATSGDETSFTSDISSVVSVIYEANEVKLSYANRAQTPTAVIDFTAEQLTGLTPITDYKINNSDIVGENIDPTWFGTEISIVKKGDGTTNADSEPQNLSIPARPAVPSVGKTDTTNGANNGTITGVTTAMEYKANGATVWTACTGTTVTGLAAGTYQVRLKATATAFVSEPASVTIASSLPKETTPNASIDYATEQLTGLTPDAAYDIDGKAYTADSNGNIDINPDWLGAEISIIKKGNGTTTDSEPQKLPIPARSTTAPSVGKTDTTNGANNGTITGVTTAMEYKANGATVWTACTGTTVTGLAPGTYQVRLKATATAFASEPASVTIENSSAPTKEAIPNASIDYATEQLTGLTPDAAYDIDGKAYTADSNGNIDINPDWLGAEISIIKKGNGTTTTDSTAQQLAVHPRPAAPDTPVGGVGQITGVTTAMEYRPVNGTSDWTACSGTIVTGLAAGDYEVRYKATGDALTGESKIVTVTDIFEDAAVTTAIVAGSPNTATITVNPAVSGFKYAVADKNGDVVGGDSGWKTGNRDRITFTGLLPGQEYKIIRVPETADKFPITGQQNTFGLITSTPEDPDKTVGTDSAIVINPANNALQYGLVDLDGNTVKPWTSPISGTVTFTGLNPEADYKVVTKPKNNVAPADPKDAVISGSISVVTAPSAVIVTRKGGDTDQISFPTVASNEYMVIEKETGAFVQGWTQGNDSERIIAGLDPLKTYEVLVRVLDTGKKCLVNSTEVPVLGVIQNAQTPIISVQPQNQSVALDARNVTLSVVASVTDKGTLSYQWYENNKNLNSGGKLITGATEASYKPLVNSKGTKYYYVVVTNTITGSDGTKTASTVSRSVFTEVGGKDVTGKVTDAAKNNAPVKDAVVKLVQGNNIIQIKITDEDGTFTFPRVPNGAYNLVVEHDGRTVTSKVQINNTDPTPSTLVLPELAKSSVVEIKGNTPEIIVGNLDEQVADTSDILTSEDLDVLENGGKIEIVFVGEEKEENAIAGDAGMIKEKLSFGQKVELYLDFSVVKKTYDQSGVQNAENGIPTLNTLLEVLVPLPVELQGMPSYSIIRVHDNVASKLNKLSSAPALNSDNEGFVENKIGGKTVSITIYAKNFSTYAVAVSEDVETPVITIQPQQYTTVTIGETVALSVTADATDGGELSYQWYRNTTNSNTNGTPIDGATDASYNPPTHSAGTTYYYVVVSNTNENATGIKSATVTSNVAAVTVRSNGSSGGSSGSGGYSGYSGSNDYNVETTSNVTITSPVNGSVVISPNRPIKGNKVTITVKPDSGYVLDKLDITDSSNKSISFTNNDDGTYTYTQPSGKVTINTTFKRDANNNIVITSHDNGKVTSAKNDSDVSALLNTKYRRSFVTGVGDNLFAPDTNMTRAETAQMFYNLLLDKNVEITKSFSDVIDNAWYAKSVNTLASLGIITGYPDGGFHPNDMITRAQFSAMVVGFAKVSLGEKHFYDVPETHWAYDYINTAANFNWVSGTGNGNFEPNRNITRAEAVTIINRMLKREPDKAYIDSSNDLIRFSDINPKHWAYYQIMEAANTYDYEKTENGE